MAGVFIFAVLCAIAVAQGQSAARRKRVQAAYKYKPENSHGGARFAQFWDLFKAGLFRRKGGLPIGYYLGRPLFYSGFGHILTIAAARTGKGATLLINALLSWIYSVVVIDPKAENVAVTGHWRKRFGRVYVLNPFNMFPDVLKGLTNARFNPMDIIDASSPAFHAMCDKLAAALVWDEGGYGVHFTLGARALVSGIIASLIRHGAKLERNLVMVARILSGDIFEFCQMTVQLTNDPFIKQKLGRFAAPNASESHEVMDVIATAIAQLSFLGSQAIADCVSSSNFDLRDLKRRPGTSLYICLPLNMLDITDKFFRLMLEMILFVLLQEGQRGKRSRILLMVDEMAQLGPHMKSLENAMGMAAGAAGVQLWCALQDLSQLIGMFPKTWETFIQNCGVTTWFGARDQTTREYVSKLAGATEVLSRSRSVSIDHNTGEAHVNDSANQCGRPLLLPHEVGQIKKDEMIAFVEGVSCGPIKAKRKFYFRVFHGVRKNPYQR
jgi:type IV secretion system protein VirD4